MNDFTKEQKNNIKKTGRSGYLQGEFFCTLYFHAGCDNELTNRCKKIGKYVWAEEAKVYHDHPIQDGYKKPLDKVYQLAYKEDRVEHDRELYKKRAKKFGFEFKENFQIPDIIPKKIFTIWLSEDKEIPELVQKCIDSQKIPGYEHKLITLKNCYKGSKYIKECLASKHDKQKWCKASDYLRMHYLYSEGGIYLDADVEVLEGKNFDNLLKNKMFAAREESGWIGSAVVGSIPGHGFVKKWISEVESNFRGDDNKCFESSMEILTKGYDEWPDLVGGFRVYESDYFFPYNHEKETTNITDNTIAHHHFMKTWKE